jgi:transposase
LTLLLKMPPKRILKTLTINDKYKFLKDVENGIREKDVAAKFNIPASTVSTILKKKAEIIKLVKNFGETCTNNKQHQWLEMH